jgi:hypothetical protein
MPHHLDAVLFVNDTLRLFWRKLDKETRKHSLVGDIHALIERGIKSRAVSADIDKKLAGAMLLGAMGQVARMAYFGEISRPVSAHVPALRQLFNARSQGADHECARTFRARRSGTVGAHSRPNGHEPRAALGAGGSRHSDDSRCRCD